MNSSMLGGEVLVDGEWVPIGYGHAKRRMYPRGSRLNPTWRDDE